MYIVAPVKPIGHIRGDPNGSDRGDDHKKILTTACTIVATLASLGSGLTEAAGDFEHKARRREQYEIAMNLNNVAANPQMATDPRPVSYEEPA